jgi:transposase
MPRNHISMRKIKEILRLRFGCKCSYEEIAKSVGAGSTTVGECLNRAKKANINWPLPDGLTDEQLEISLYPSAQKAPLKPKDQQGKIDWIYIHQELKRKHVTLMLLWNEYKQNYPNGLGYSQFCYRYREWGSHLDVWMRQPHKAGEKLFVDYAGRTVPVLVNKSTGEIGEAQIFVATLGASNFTYAEASWTQTLPDWIKSHVNAFEFFGGCPEIVVPDNLKSGVQKSHLYEPDINPTYQDMATHYGVAVIPARANSPKDKAKVENGVQQIERHILAKLRNRVFLSLQELNQTIRPLLDELNSRPFQKLPGSRLSQFNALEKPALKPLPLFRYEYAEWKKVKAGFNYHIELDKHFYSIPFTLVKKELHVRYNTRTVEVFYQNARIASHVRSYVAHGYTTASQHMPQSHQHHTQWTPERIIAWARKIGQATAQFIEAVMAARSHPQQGFRSCVGIIRLAKSYGNDRLELACQRALHIGAYSYKSVESILKNKLDKRPLPSASREEVMPNSHEYIRGQNYFE